MQALFQYKDFGHFIDSSVIMNCTRRENQFERIVYEMLQDEAKQNVRYVEASFSTPDHTRVGLNYSKILRAINRAVERAHFDIGVDFNLKIDLVRD